MHWISHLTHDREYVKEGLHNMPFPSLGTLTSKALKSAQIELINSRPHVPTVVIVMTDGEPYSMLHTKMNAEALKSASARLMMVPVGVDLPEGSEALKNFEEM